MRGVANPNIGFICQLLQWHKRRTEDVHVPRLYRMTPQSPSAPLYLVPKNATALDPRGAFVLHADNELCVWTGKNCPEAFHIAALHFAGQLHRYEGAPALPVCVQQGQETGEFWNKLESVVLAVSRSGTSTPPPAAAPGSAGPRDVRAVSSYDRDFDLYTRALTPSSNDSPCDSARSGRKTPRSEVPHISPNDRLRKQARSEALERERERSARSSGGSSTYSGSGLGTESARNRALDFQELAVRRIMGRPPLTPRSACAGGSGATGINTDDASGSGAAVARGVSRLGIPRLALSTLGGGSGGDGTAAMAVAAPALPAAGSNRAAAAAPRTASLIGSEDEDEDIDTSTDSDASTANGNEAEEEKGPTANRPKGVPRLNLENR